VKTAQKKPASLALDPVLHQQVRLAIASVLAARGETTFNELRDALATSDGNLSTHLRHLEEARYLAIARDFDGRKPLTTYGLSPVGRAAFARYIRALEAVIKEARR
jgi:DNA-binding transcriptional ArsR family regulator